MTDNNMIIGTLTDISAGDVFNNADKMESVLVEIETAARAVVPDMTTAKGRKEIASTAARVARSKTYMDGLGKEMVRDLKAKTGTVDDQRRMLRKRLDALKVEVRQPLTDLEEAEEARKQAIRDRLNAIYALREKSGAIDVTTASFDEVITIVETVDAIVVDNAFEEYQHVAQNAKDETLYCLSNALQQLVAREKDEADAKKLRLAEQMKQRKELEERIAREAAEQAKQKAEEQSRKAIEDANRRAKQAEMEKQAAEDRELRAADQANRDAEQAEQRRAQEIADAEAKAKQDAENAARQERHRIEAKLAEEEAKLKEKADAENKRAANHAHKKQINNTAVNALASIPKIDQDTAKEIVIAIINGQVPNVTISY